MSSGVENTMPSGNRKELIVIGFFPPPVTGQSILTEQFAEHMEQDWDVHRVNLSPPDEGDYVQWKAGFSLSRAKHYIARRREVREDLQSKPEATVVWPAISPSTLGHLRDLVVVAPAFHPKQTVMGVVHWGSFHRLFESPLTRVTARKLVDRLRGLVFNDEVLAERCAGWIPPEKRFVMRNTVGADVLMDATEVDEKINAGKVKSDLHILFLSNMIESKGYLDLLDALQILKARKIEFRATFAGGWEADKDEKEFATRVQTHELGDRVRHLGSVRDRGSVRRLFVEADVFVLPTYYPTEAQPLSIVEALNAGTPVITTRHASIPKMIVGDRDGLFVEPRSPESIADALNSLANRERWTDFARGARERFEQVFHPRIITAQWNELLSGND